MDHLNSGLYTAEEIINDVGNRSEKSIQNEAQRPEEVRLRHKE